MLLNEAHAQARLHMVGSVGDCRERPVVFLESGRDAFLSCSYSFRECAVVGNGGTREGTSDNRTFDSEKHILECSMQEYGAGCGGTAWSYIKRTHNARYYSTRPKHGTTREPQAQAKVILSRQHNNNVHSSALTHCPSIDAHIMST